MENNETSQEKAKLKQELIYVKSVLDNMKEKSKKLQEEYDEYSLKFKNTYENRPNQRCNSDPGLALHYSEKADSIRRKLSPFLLSIEQEQKKYDEILNKIKILDDEELKYSKNRFSTFLGRNNGLALNEKRNDKKNENINYSSVDKINDKTNDKVIEKSDPDKNKCVICQDKNKESLFLPCAHKICCQDCGKKVFNDSKKCPVCRKNILQFVEQIYE